MEGQRVPIEALFASELIREEETIEQIRIGNNVKGQVNGLWYYNRTFAIKCIKDNLYKDAKLHFYTYGRIDEYLIKKYDSRLLDAGMANVCYALLSDDSGLIKRYTELGHTS